MRVYEAIVKALESVGVDAAFGGAGENAAGAMIALKHSTKIRPVIVARTAMAAVTPSLSPLASNRAEISSRVSVSPSGSRNSVVASRRTRAYPR